MGSSRQPQEIVTEKKKKKKWREFRRANREEQEPAKTFKDYDFTPLNAGISEVLM
jgi:hypothetical protein